MSDRKAHLAEIEENARKHGFALIAAQRPVLEQNVRDGRISKDICEAMTVESNAIFHRLCGEMCKAGASGKEMKRYVRGLHAGMKAGLIDIYKPYLEAI